MATRSWKRKLLRGVGFFVGFVVLGIASYAGYAAATARGRLYFPDTPYPGVRSSTDPAKIERGRYLVHGPAHCASCHGPADRRHPERIRPDVPLTGGLEFAMGPIGTRYAANLTPDRATGIARRTDAELARTIRTGVLHDGELSILMRFAASNLSDDDLSAVLSYLRSLPAKKRATSTGSWSLFGKMLLPLFEMGPRRGNPPRGVPASETPTIERGRYLAEDVMLCVSCHTKVDQTTFLPVGPKAGGSDPDPSHGHDADMEFVAPNLTSHGTGMTGKLSEDQFLERIRAGRQFESSIMPWENFGQATEADLRSVYRYLASLPPVDHDVGPTYRRQGTHPAH